ncbi:uncharacterized protein LOC141908580 [Tubulanus polymorphus]|uniref:uncharacterized protein LOC141908580 n=1 Tax=Tubulanus polymorphus TaxID=672921 RepID=UPI003DA3224B
MERLRVCVLLLCVVGCSFSQELCSDVLGKLTQVTTVKDRPSLELIVETGLDVEIIWLKDEVPIITDDIFTIAANRTGITTRSKLSVAISHLEVLKKPRTTFEAKVALKGCQTYTFVAPFWPIEDSKFEILMGTIESTPSVLYLEDNSRKLELKVNMTVPADKPKAGTRSRKPVSANRWRYVSTTNGTVAFKTLGSYEEGANYSWLSNKLFSYGRLNVIETPDNRVTGLYCATVYFYGLIFRELTPHLRTCVAVQSRADKGVIKRLTVRMIDLPDASTNPTYEDTIDIYETIPLIEGKANGIKVAVYGYPAPPITVYKVHNHEVVKPVAVENNGVYTMNWYYLPPNKDPKETWTMEAGNQGRLIPFTKIKPITILGPRGKARHIKGDKTIDWMCAATGNPRPEITFYKKKGFYTAFALYNDNTAERITSVETLTSGEMVASLADLPITYTRRNSFTYICKISTLYESRGRYLYVGVTE